MYIIVLRIFYVLYSTCMNIDLSKVGQRSQLGHRREPYWQRLRKGCFIGYRPSKSRLEGNWIARATCEDTRKYKHKKLGDYGSFAKHERFDVARNDAEKFFQLIENGENIRVISTVRDACLQYASDKLEAQKRLERTVYHSDIADIPLSKLRKRHLLDWRTNLQNKTCNTKEQGVTGREKMLAPSTLNRELVPLRAALHKVLPIGTPNTEAAWQEALKPIKNADRQRTLYLDQQQRMLLLSNANSEIEPLLRSLCYLPLRVGTVAKLLVMDFDARTSELTIGKDKNGQSRKIIVPETTAKFLVTHCASKEPTDPIFCRQNGAIWSKETWKKPIKDAVCKARLNPKTTAYTLRHSTITDLVTSGLPILTIAQISGTSVEMIEKHYGHLRNDAALTALEQLASSWSG